MSARSQALVPLSTEQQAAWRAVAETEKRRHQGNTLAEYPYAGAFFRCLNGSRRISLSDLRFFMPSLTQWGERFPSLAGMERWQWQDMPFWQVIAEASLAAREAGHAVREMERWMVPNKLREAA